MVLVDTGAIVKSVDVRDRSDELIKRTMVSPSDVQHVTGRRIRIFEIVGEDDVAVTLGSLKCSIRRMVITDDDSAPFPCLLGMDFLGAYCLQINIVRMTLSRCK